MKDKLREYLDGFLKPKEYYFAKRAVYAFEEKDLIGDVSSFISDNKDDNRFQKLLFSHIDRKNLKDSEVYNKVGIDRRLFSKIRNNSYHPSKDTVILLAIALELNEDELDDFLFSASYSLPKNNYFDLIIRFCFREGIYDLFTINEYLNDYDCKTLSN